MKRMILLAAALLLFLTACGKEAAPSETPSPASPSPTVTVPPSDTSSPEVTESPAAPPDPKAGEYYDLFEADPGLTVLFGLMENGADFTDEQLCAYAITILGWEGRYEYETGVTKEEMNTITQKHFGRDIENFENDMTTVLEDGRVTATGWSFDSSVYLALDGPAVEQDGVITGTFRCYQLGDSIWLDDEVEEDKLANKKEYLLSGNDEDFPEPIRVEVVFEERFDPESQSSYVFYHSIGF